MSIPTRNWTKSDFPSELSSNLDYVGITNYYWPNSTNISLTSYHSNVTGYQPDFFAFMSIGCVEETWPTGINWGDYYGKQLTYLWVDGEYNYEDPHRPVKYSLRAGQRVIWDPESTNDYIHRLQRNQLIDVDGRTHYFWNLAVENYNYYNEGLISSYFVFKKVR